MVATVEHTQSSTSPNPSLQNRAKCAIGSEVCPGRHRLTVTLPPETAFLESSKALGPDFEQLEKAYQERQGGLIFLKVDPHWDPLRDDPRFHDLLP